MQNLRRGGRCLLPTSTPLLIVLQPFAMAFTGPTGVRALTLVHGTLLASGRRTVAAPLRALGRAEERHCTTTHRVRNRCSWSPLQLSWILLEGLVTTVLPPAVPLVLLVDGPLERRRGRTIRLNGRYHDLVRSQTGHVAMSEGMHWRCLLLVSCCWCPAPGAHGAGFALGVANTQPVRTVPTCSPALSRTLRTRHRATLHATARHCTTPEDAETLIALERRWQPSRERVLIGDSTVATAGLGLTCRRMGVPLVSRLLLTAQLDESIPPQPKGKPGVKTSRQHVGLTSGPRE